MDEQCGVFRLTSLLKQSSSIIFTTLISASVSLRTVSIHFDCAGVYCLTCREQNRVHSSRVENESDYGFVLKERLQSQHFILRKLKPLSISQELKLNFKSFEKRALLSLDVVDSYIENSLNSRNVFPYSSVAMRKLQSMSLTAPRSRFFPSKSTCIMTAFS